MAKNTNKTGPRNPDGSQKGKPTKAFDDRRTDQGNPDKQTSAVSSEDGIRQLINAGCEIIETPDAKYKKGEPARTRSWIKQRFGIESPKLSNTADSVHMGFDGDGEPKTFTISVKGMLAFKALKNIEDITGIHLVSNQVSEKKKPPSEVCRPAYMDGYTGDRWQPDN